MSFFSCRPICRFSNPWAICEPSTQRLKEIDPRVRRKSGHDPVPQARWCHIKPLTIQGDRDSSMYLLRTGTRSVGSCRESMRRRLGGWGQVVGRGYSGPLRSTLNLAEPHWISTMVCRSFCRLSRAERGRGRGSGVVEEESFNPGESKISHPERTKKKPKVWGCDLCRGRRSAVCDMHAGQINAYARLAALRVVDIQWSVGSCLHFSLGG